MPHNLVAAQESPVPLLNLQIAPRLKILMASGSKRGTQIYFSFLSKVPANEPPSRSPNRAPMEREARLQSILRISQKPHLSGSPLKDPSLKLPIMESLAERCPTTRALLHSPTKVTSIRAPPPHIPGSRRIERRRNGVRCPHPETSLTYLPGSPVKELPPRPPPQCLFRERWTIPRAPSSGSRSNRQTCPKRGPYGKRCPSPEPFLHILQGPRQGSPPSRFPSQSSHRERHSTSRAPFNHISKSPVSDPTLGCPSETQ